MKEIRKKRIENEIVRLISIMILNGHIKDPRISMVSVHRSEINSDHSHVKVWISSFCSQRKQTKLLNGLNSASGYLSSVISKKLRLRLSPKMKFVWDSEYMKMIQTTHQ